MTMDFYDAQLLLDIPGWEPLSVDPTPAMRDGRQSIVQCSWCGCVVIPPRAVQDAALMQCPCCLRTGGWWRQVLPVAGVSTTSTSKDS